MIDKGVPPKDGWPEGLLGQLAAWQQGDVLTKPPLFYYADPSAPIWIGTRAYTGSSTEPEVILPSDELLPPYGLITTQTCDIAEGDSVRPTRPWIQVAPIYNETTWKRHKLEGGAGPRYWLLVPQMPEDGVWVADLRIEVPIEKSWLAGQEPIQGFPDEEAKRQVGRRLAWLRGRPAFSTALNSVHRSLFHALGGLETDQPELSGSLLGCLEEVAVQVDSHLLPKDAQFVFLTTTDMPIECREWLNQWRDGEVAQANEDGLALQALDFRKLEEVSAAEYRRMTPIWQK